MVVCHWAARARRSPLYFRHVILRSVISLTDISDEIRRQLCRGIGLSLAIAITVIADAYMLAVIVQYH